MKTYFIISLMLLSFTSHAKITSIYDIWEPDAGEKTYLILATDRQVYELAAHQQSLLTKIYQAKDQHLKVKLDLEPLKIRRKEELFNTRRTISNVEFSGRDTQLALMPGLTDETAGLNPSELLSKSLEDAKITTVNSMNSASQYFRNLTVGTRSRSQCYNRAHVWSFDLWKKYKFSSMKVWLFFTRRYIKKYRFKWWFHVSPATQIEGRYGYYALDRKYTRGPTEISHWKDIFVKSKGYCPRINTYSDYSNNQNAYDCYYLLTSMYFWQPYQIENLERGFNAPNWWDQSQINVAYKDAIYTGKWWWRRKLVIPQI